VIEAGVAVKELITGAATGWFTVTATDRLTVPPAFVAVRVYVVFAPGVTTLEVPVTVPTPLSMLKLAVPPDKVQASVVDCPDVTEAGVAVKDPITGAATGSAIVTVALRVGAGETTKTESITQA
jgi:hypothetical protein